MEAGADAKQIYYRLLDVADYFIKHASLVALNLEALRDLNPSVEQIAKDMRSLAVIIKALAGNSFEDDNMGINALQCAWAMERIVTALARNETNELEEMVAHLELLTRAP
jgi:hypothetical protein